MPRRRLSEPVADVVSAVPQEPETEVFYTFTWSGRSGREDRRGGTGEKGKGRSKGGERRKGKSKEQQPEKARSFAAKPQQRKDRIDPDNPFAAALMGLKNKS